MNTDQLLKNLAELEKQLQGIKSATEQVKAVTAADRKLYESINTYNATAEKLLLSVQSTAKEDVKEMKESAIREIKSTQKDFQKTTGGIASDLTASVDGIKAAALEEMADISKGFEKQVKESASGLDVSVNVLKETAQVFRSFAEENLSEPLDKDLKVIVNDELRPLVDNEIPKAVEESIDRMEDSFEAVQKRMSEEWTTRQAAYEESVKKQHEVINASIKQLKDQATVFSETVNRFKASIEGLGSMIDGAKNTVINTLSGKTGQLMTGIGGVMTAIGSAIDAVEREASHIRESIRTIEGEVHREFQVIESQQEDLRRSMSAGFSMCEGAVDETKSALLSDNETTRRDIACVTKDVKSHKPLLVTAIVLLGVVLILQLVPFAIQLFK